MSIIRRLEIALKDKDIYKKTAAEHIGVPPTTMQTWFVRGTDFPAQYVIPLCELLEVSPTWLLTGQEVLPSKIPADHHRLNDDEWFLVSAYRTLDRAGQIVVSNSAVAEQRRCDAVRGRDEEESAG